jgi:hypothetical protein
VLLPRELWSCHLHQKTLHTQKQGEYARTHYIEYFDRPTTNNLTNILSFTIIVNRWNIGKLWHSRQQITTHSKCTLQKQCVSPTQVGEYIQKWNI